VGCTHELRQATAVSGQFFEHGRGRNRLFVVIEQALKLRDVAD
jgi:hypothetical protein